jgi:hypothetical protein
MRLYKLEFLPYRLWCVNNDAAEGVLKMAKRIRKDRAALAMGVFTSKYPGVENVAKLEVVVIDDRARVGFHMYSDADEIEKAEFASLFATKGFVEMNNIDGPDTEKSPEEIAEKLRDEDALDEDGNIKETVDPALGTIAEALEQGAAEPIENTENVGRAADDATPSAEPAKKKGKGRPKMTTEQRLAKVAAAVKQPKPEKTTKKTKIVKEAKANGTGAWKAQIAAAAENKAKTLAEGKPAFRPGSQREKMMQLLIEGTTIAHLEEVIGQTRKSKGGWVSSFNDLVGVLSKKLESIKVEGGERVYKMV